MEKRIDLRELTLMWLRESEGALGKETCKLYAWHMEQYVLPRFGDAVAISEAEMRAFLEELRGRGLSDSTVLAVKRVTQRALEYGASLGLCEAPLWAIGLGAPQKKRQSVVLTPAEEARLCAYLTDNPSGKHLGLFLMLTTGIQIGEAVELKWEDISLKKGEMRVRSERGPVVGRMRKVRTVPIGERQKIYLRKRQGRPEAYICTGTEKKLARPSLEKCFRNIVAELLLPPMSPTCLRHTYAVRCIESGMDYETLSKELGVGNGRSFRKLYSELVSEEQKERLERERDEALKARMPVRRRGPSVKDPEVEALESKVEKRKRELRELLENLEGDLAIIRTLRNSDCVQGQAREGFYSFVEAALGPDDKDGRVLVEYMRCNMRVADMPLRKSGALTVQAIRRRVAHGFAKLTAKISI